MYRRNILFIDDEFFEESIQDIKDIIEEISKEDESINRFDFDFEIIKSIEEALERLNSKNKVYHTLVIDYKFNNAQTQITGVDLVRRIRETVNKNCNIIFNTMNGSTEESLRDFAKLIDLGVYKFISKAEVGTEYKYKYKRIDGFEDEAETQLLAEAIIDSVANINVFSISLEEYIYQHKEILEYLRIDYNGTEYKLDEILRSIQLDDELGRMFQKSLMELTMQSMVKNSLF